MIFDLKMIQAFYKAYPARVDAALARVRGLPPLVHPAEIDQLNTLLAARTS